MIPHKPAHLDTPQDASRLKRFGDQCLRLACVGGAVFFFLFNLLMLALMLLTLAGCGTLSRDGKPAIHSRGMIDQPVASPSGASPVSSEATGYRVALPDVTLEIVVSPQTQEAWLVDADFAGGAR